MRRNRKPVIVMNPKNTRIVKILAPAAPTGLTATAGNTQVALSWSPVIGATSYNVKRSTTTGTEVNVHTGITTTAYIDTGLTNGTQYFYKITATNAAGTGAASSEANATPAAPAKLQIGLNIPSATNAHIAQADIGLTRANTSGFGYVRASIGIDGMGGIEHPDMQYVTKIVTDAIAAGAARCSLLLNMNPKLNDTWILALNNGVTWNTQTRPPAGTGNALWTWIGTNVWQAVIDAAIAACVAQSVTAANFLEFEGANEVDKGGVGTPQCASTVAGAVLGPDGKWYEAPFITQEFGATEANWFVMADFIGGLINLHGCKFIPITCEGDGSDTDTDNDTDAQEECNSFVGAHAVSYMALGTSVGFNCYGAKPASPYSSASYKAVYTAKVNAQLARMNGNAILSGMTKEIREFGLKTGNQPADGTDCNTVRNDLVAAVEVMTTISQGALYTAFTDTSYRICNDDGTFINGVAVGPF